MSNMAWRNKKNIDGCWVLCRAYIQYKKEGGPMYPEEWNKMMKDKYGKKAVRQGW